VRHPVHVTLRRGAGAPSLRSAAVFPALRGALAAASHSGFRVVHFSVQVDHVHLVVEADLPLRLARGVQGLAIRCARAVNRCAGRRGAVWSDRYHARALATPREVRRGMVYVLLNFRKHLRAGPGIDPCSSGPWFDGWRRAVAAKEAAPVASARTWLATVGWRRAGGLIDWREMPRVRSGGKLPFG
jgi:REP element-mobilizing transposase RayT